MNRTRSSILIMSAFAACVLVGMRLTLSMLKGASHATSIGGPFHLEDQFGESVTEANLRGRPTLIFFGYTHCPDVCPTSLFDLSEVLRGMGKDADRVNAFFVSVDPDRDTRADMKEYLSSFDPHLKGLTGSREELAKMTAEYRVYSKKVPLQGGDYTIDHTSVVYLLNRQGGFAKTFDLKRTPQASATDLERYL